ncbi:MAG: hypothetical protein Q8Q14_12100 [Gemmatimonadales bacterium]|nr:hypothetical protein [Gemmatimonadales bacterium]
MSFSPARAVLWALATPALLAAQTPAAASPAASAPSYRGFTPGRPYQEFATRARELAGGDALRCNTSRQTAQLMECGVMIRDPKDSARFYLSAYVLEGRIAMVSFTDSGGPRLVEWARRDLTTRLGPPKRRERSMLEWSSGRHVARLNWRGAGQARWISITLRDDEVMDRIARYVNRSRKGTP